MACAETPCDILRRYFKIEVESGAIKTGEKIFPRPDNTSFLGHPPKWWLVLVEVFVKYFELARETCRGKGTLNWPGDLSY